MSKLILDKSCYFQYFSHTKLITVNTPCTPSPSPTCSKPVIQQLSFWLYHIDHPWVKTSHFTKPSLASNIPKIKVAIFWNFIQLIMFYPVWNRLSQDLTSPPSSQTLPLPYECAAGSIFSLATPSYGVSHAPCRLRSTIGCAHPIAPRYRQFPGQKNRAAPRKGGHPTFSSFPHFSWAIITSLRPLFYCPRNTGPPTFVVLGGIVYPSPRSA